MKQRFLLFLAILLLCSQELKSQSSCSVPTSEKNDCGYVGINQSLCQNKGCCWYPVNPNPTNIPWCYYSSSSNVCNSIDFSSTSMGFDSNAYNTMYGYYTANLNIQGKGGVVASPDTDIKETGGSYYYHWMRDGALSMRAFMAISSNMNAYVQWVLNVQQESDPNGQAILTEPKFNLPNGDVFTGGWCRPQNDGPALRSTTLMLYANALSKSGNSQYVKQYLWSASGGAIKADLDYIASNWQSSTCDLWEEITNNNFFWNMMNFRRAMINGASFAQSMGDSVRQNNYQSQVSAIENQINSHWADSYIFESTNRLKDAAVMEGFYDGWVGDSFFAPLDTRIANTITVLNNLFCFSFSINQLDNNNSIPGVMYGRYQGDQYVGGNPWILTTAALAQVFYQAANYALNQSSISSSTITAWQQAIQFNNSSPSVQQFATYLANAGNSVLYRLYYHTKGDNFHLYEQIDKNDGHQASAYDLTWSYANVLQAMKLGNSVQAKLKKYDENEFLQWNIE